MMKNNFQEGDWAIWLERGTAGEVRGPAVNEYWPLQYACKCEGCTEESILWVHDSQLELWLFKGMVVLHLGCDGDLRPGLVNMDRTIDGWHFEHGLDFPNESVDGITISHALQCVNPEKLSYVLGEFWRVLKPNGLIRITDDDTDTVDSRCFRKLAPGAKLWTGLHTTRLHFLGAGFETTLMRHDQTRFTTKALLIAHREHKKPPYYFYMEAKKRATSR